MSFLFIHTSPKMEHMCFSQKFTICNFRIAFLADTCLGLYSKAGLQIERDIYQLSIESDIIKS